MSNDLLHTSLAQLQQSADDTISLANGAPMSIPLTAERTVLTAIEAVHTKPRNPCHFDGIEGGRKRVADSFSQKQWFMRLSSKMFNAPHYFRFAHFFPSTPDDAAHGSEKKALGEHNHCLMHYFGVKTLSETFSPLPFMKPGDGTRSMAAWPAASITSARTGLRART